MSHNRMISHFGPHGRPLCGRMDGHILVRDVARFVLASKPCKSCAAKLPKPLPRPLQTLPHEKAARLIHTAEEAMGRALSAKERADLLFHNMPGLRSSEAAHLVYLVGDR